MDNFCAVIDRRTGDLEFFEVPVVAEGEKVYSIFVDLDHPDRPLVFDTPSRSNLDPNRCYEDITPQVVAHILAQPDAGNGEVALPESRKEELEFIRQMNTGLKNIKQEPPSPSDVEDNTAYRDRGIPSQIKTEFKAEVDDGDDQQNQNEMMDTDSTSNVSASAKRRHYPITIEISSDDAAAVDTDTTLSESDTEDTNSQYSGSGDDDMSDSDNEGPWPWTPFRHGSMVWAPGQDGVDQIAIVVKPGQRYIDPARSIDLLIPDFVKNHVGYRNREEIPVIFLGDDKSWDVVHQDKLTLYVQDAGETGL